MLLRLLSEISIIKNLLINLANPHCLMLNTFHILTGIETLN